MTRKLGDSHYVNNWERMSLLPLPTFTLIRFFTFLGNFQCKWMLWWTDSKTIIHGQARSSLWTYENCFEISSRSAVAFFLFLTLLFLSKSFYLIQSKTRICCNQKRVFKMIQNIKYGFAKSRNKHVAKISCDIKVHLLCVRNSFSHKQLIWIESKHVCIINCMAVIRKS